MYITICVNLACTVLDESSQMQKGMDCMIPFIWHLGQSKRQGQKTDQWLPRPGGWGGVSMKNHIPLSKLIKLYTGRVNFTTCALYLHKSDYKRINRNNNKNKMHAQYKNLPPEQWRGCRGERKIVRFIPFVASWILCHTYILLIQKCCSEKKILCAYMHFHYTPLILMQMLSHFNISELTASEPHVTVSFLSDTQNNDSYKGCPGF